MPAVVHVKVAPSQYLKPTADNIAWAPHLLPVFTPISVQEAGSVGTATAEVVDHPP